METTQGAKIEKVDPGSPAEAAGIKAGWQLLRIDNMSVGDIIDYKIMESDDELRLLLMNELGILHRVKIFKPVSAPLGLQFNPPTITEMQNCGNRCIFCFVDQNPAGMRSALYVKDDDYRLSFLYGNFITLNRLNSSELDRIIRLRLSPLYVSVHTTNLELRKRMFGTKKAEKGLINLQYLVNEGIQVHAQVVLCPGVNTGHEMKRTITDLSKMGLNLVSVALVPIGLTAHRSGLKNLRKFNSKEAKELIDWLEERQQLFLKDRGTRFVFAADEFYNLASFPLPNADQYEGYPQLENGVGLARHFLEELALTEKQKFATAENDLTITIAAGPAAETILQDLVRKFSAIEGLSIDLRIIRNCFFGEQVTVSGLLTGSDLLTALAGTAIGDGVFISKTMLKEGRRVFLDGLTVEEIEQALNVPVYAVSGPLELLSKLKAIAVGTRSEHKRSPEH